MATATLAVAIGTSGAAAPATAAGVSAHGASGTTAVYDSIPSPLPGNLPSWANEAYSTDEFGNEVDLAPSAQPLRSVQVVMSSWACQSGSWVVSTGQGTCSSVPGSTFTEPITFTIYAAGADGAVGPVLATDTQTFAIPYRPSADPVHCPATPAQWYSSADGACHNGYAVPITFDFSAQHVVLPSTVIYGITYNTTHHGYHPYGQGTACYTQAGGPNCPYDSLNMALSKDPTDVTVGSDPDPGRLYLNSSFAGWYCDDGAAGTGTFRLDSPDQDPAHCATGSQGGWSVSGGGAPWYVPAVEFDVATPTPPTPSVTGYWTSATDGGVFAFGGAGFYGSMGGQHLNSPVVGMASTPDGRGYWLVAKDGGIFAFGDATFFGSMGGQPLNSPVVAMASTPDGRGYWLVAQDGGIFAFGDAAFDGSMGGQALNAPVVGMAATTDGQGYWLVAKDGGVFGFGDAAFSGSMGGQHLNSPVVGMASAAGGGYWLVAADGGIFAFGGASFDGSMGGQPLNAPIVGMASTPQGLGYWLIGTDGGIFAFGDPPFFGSMGGQPLNAPMVAMAAQLTPLPM